MARITPSPIIGNIVNKLHTTIYQNYRGIIVARSYPKQVENPKTDEQEKIRRIVAELPKRWRKLNSGRYLWAERAQEYKPDGTQSPMIIRPPKYPMSGYNLFCRWNILFKRYTGTWIDLPPSEMTKPAPTILEVAYEPTDNKRVYQFCIKFVCEAGDTVLFWVRPPEPYYPCIIGYKTYPEGGENKYTFTTYKDTPVQYIVGRWCFQAMSLGAKKEISAPSNCVCLYNWEVGMLGVGDVIYEDWMSVSNDTIEYAVSRTISFRKDPGMTKLSAHGYLHSKADTETAFIKIQITDEAGNIISETPEYSQTGTTWLPLDIPIDVATLTNGSWYFLKFFLKSSATKISAVFEYPVVWVSEGG